MDMRVTFDHHQLINFNGSTLTNPTQVVAFQVDQHDVLGPLLGMGHQFGRQRSILIG